MAEDELGVDVKNLTAEAAEVPVAASVGGAPEAMVGAIYFDDEPEGRGEEVGDGVAENDLAAECDAELRAGECGPEESLGLRGGAAVGVSARGEKVAASC